MDTIGLFKSARLESHYISSASLKSKVTSSIGLRQRFPRSVHPTEQQFFLPQQQQQQQQQQELAAAATTAATAKIGSRTKMPTKVPPQLGPGPFQQLSTASGRNAPDINNIAEDLVFSRGNQQ